MYCNFLNVKINLKSPNSYNFLHQKLTAMKRLLILFVIFNISLSAQAQKLYSEQNLQKLSQEELSIYLTHSKKLKKTGAIISISGAALKVTGIVVISVFEPSYMGEGQMIGALMTVSGIGALLIGLPILVTGANRVQRINEILDIRLNKASINVVPYQTYNSLVNRNQTGITFRIKL